MLAVDDLFEASHRLLEVDVDALRPGEGLGDVAWLREKLLDAAGAPDWTLFGLAPPPPLLSYIPGAGACT